MKILIKDLSKIEIKARGTCVRFSITFLRDDGRAFVTQKGYTIDKTRHVQAPMTKGRFGKMTTFTDISEDARVDLKAMLGTVKAVDDILGTPVEFDAPIVEKEDMRIEGEVESVV